ncbi:hypothetical protein BGZ75_009395 [Mortierella antarctica]|nr:hypothetical protein BGZ75_009395 [Mortierella antarctica]
MELNGDRKPYTLTWYGSKSWAKLEVTPANFENVDALLLHPIRMTGTGHSQSLYLLPRFNAGKKLIDLHLVMSCEGRTGCTFATMS